jgi:hypothetical protein
VATNRRSKLSVLFEMTLLRLGRGRLSPQEYFDLRLCDDGLGSYAEKKGFVGLAVARKIWFRVNFRVDLFAIATNKIASAIWFAAHGLPILPTIALFHEDVGRPGARLLQNETQLRSFLRDSSHYPLFGKPIEGSQSIGSASIESYVPSHDSLITTAGRMISLDNFVAYVKSHAKSGYQFQSRVNPHAAVGEMCGNRLATVRLLTVFKDGKPKIIRACWKIPAGQHAADNFWRPGNLLAQLDLDSGHVLRVIRANGDGYEETTHHPDTGIPIVGSVVPNWNEVTRLALDGARLLNELPLVGWDIAPIDSGAVLVEANVTPDFRLHQLADKRGILDQDFARFLMQRKSDTKNYLGAGRKKSFLTWLSSLMRAIAIAWRNSSLLRCEDSYALPITASLFVLDRLILRNLICVLRGGGDFCLD